MMPHPPARRPRPRSPKPPPRTLVIWPWATFAGLGDLAHWVHEREARDTDGLFHAICGAVGIPCEDYDRQIVDACVDCDRSLRWELVH